jgi:hypothetical protein
MIYLRFVTTKWAIESALIRFATRSEFSHVEFVRTEEPIIGAKVPLGPAFAIDTLGALLDGGVEIRPYRSAGITREEWYSAPDIEAAYEEGKAFIGLKYDWLDIVGIALDTGYHRDDRMICSRFALYANRRAWALRGSKPWVNPDRSAWLCTPSDLLWSPLLKKERVVK